MNKIKELIYENKIIAIIRGVETDRLLKLAEILYEGGIRLIEVTINQSGDVSATSEAISRLCERFENRMEIGAGTVMTAAQAETVTAAGAKYIISPNTDERVITRTKELGVLSLPGAMTPSEAAAAYGYGADFIKIFPAGLFGAEYIKAIKAPLSHIPMLAVGGITADNMLGFLEAGACGLGVGGALTNPDTEPEALLKIVKTMTKKVSFNEKIL